MAYFDNDSKTEEWLIKPNIFIMKHQLTLKEITERLPKDSMLTVIDFAAHSCVVCRCVCGTEKTIRISNILGTTRSCGCLAIGLMSKYPLSLRKVYQNMMRRCYNKSQVFYHLYGGSGVKVCKEWRKDRFSFLEWAINNGYKKGLQLDKDIKGNGKLYSPDMCMFVTPTVNVRARGVCKKYSFGNKLMTMAELSDQSAVSLKTLWKRIVVLNWDLEKAVTTKKRGNK